jgi:hypothetical protein
MTSGASDSLAVDDDVKILGRPVDEGGAGGASYYVLHRCREGAFKAPSPSLFTSDSLELQTGNNDELTYGHITKVSCIPSGTI